MSVDTVNEALTKVRLNITNNRQLWGFDGAHSLALHCECMRYYLMQDDIEAFISFTQKQLGEYPDSMTEILNQLFAEVCGNEQAVWEEFEAKLREE